MGFEDRDYYREEGYRREMRVGPYLITKLTIAIISLCLVIFVFQKFFPALTRQGGLTFYSGFRPWQIVTYQYLHASASHVFFNCLGIFFFLPSLESRWGWKKTLLFYTFGGIFAGLIFGLMQAATQLPVPIIGASGSVLACIGACALLFPLMQLILLVFPVPIRVAAALFAIFYLLSVLGDQNRSNGLSNACHLGGLVFGFFAPMTVPWFSALRQKWVIKKEQDWIQEDRRQQQIVDQILEKVHKTGMNSLTSGEKKALKKATEWQRKRDGGK